ncbi:SpaA isopeptide-forming pilin-related protein [Enterococcus faecalis]|uniref:SpaA isopeptide-forming pilin-related protein n=1 Tax=Enterococcus faecalis TaxID=1351 RepID=UPI0025AEEB57|nr:SpaA isopeptide-forming pilin-related protein [Enterococcus faecalis]MDN3200482.1 SpaA isopeptide-forming pilin-related protein [Enterococcus faecalis]
MKKQSHTHFLKRKKWLYSSLVLGVLAGGVVGSEMIQANNPSITAQAISLPSGVTQVGTINGVPVVKSTTNNMGSQSFQDIVSSLLGETGYPPYIINEAYWGNDTTLVNGKPLSSIGEAAAQIFGRDGFLPSDLGIEIPVGGRALIRNVGTAINTADGSTIPLSLGITVKGATQPDGTPLDKVVMGAKSQSSVITLAWGSLIRGGENTGGSTEGGGIGGSSSDGTLMQYIDQIRYTLTFINTNTGQALSNDTLMPIKNSDIDANQLAEMDGNGAIGYIVSPNTALVQQGNGFRSTSSGAINEDSVHLTENSYVVLKKYNSNSVQYNYQDDLNNHVDIVTGHFGRMPFKINELMGGYISIDKSTFQFGKDLWNKNYSFDTLAFDVMDKKGKILDTIRLDKKGNGKSSYLPVGEYDVVERSSNWSASGQTVRSNMTVKVEAGKTVTVKPQNKAVRGKIKITKSLDHGYDKTLPNKLYAFKGIQYKITSSDKKFTDIVTLDETGSGTSKELPLDTYDVQEIPSSVTSTTGQVVNPKVYKVTLSYANQTTELVTSTSAVTNTPVLGEITVKKTGIESGTEMWNTHYSLKGNEFKLTSKTDGKTYTIVTDEKGVAKKAELPLGKYLVEETKASAGFVNTFKPVEVELSYKNNTTKVVFGSAEGTNQEIKGENTLEKEDTETGKESQGKADMKNAEYQLFYDEDQTGKSSHKKGDPVKWSDIPKAKLLAGEKVTSSVINGKEVNHGDNVVINVDDKKLNVAVGNLALGKYVWREINAPEGYVLDKTEHRFELTKKDDKTQNIVFPTITSKEKVIEAEVTIQKLVETQGESNESGYNGVEFTFTPLEGTKGEPVVVKTGVNSETNEDGFARAKLVYGDYVMKETKGVEGYDKIRDVYIHMETDEEKDLLTISASNQADFSKPFSKRTFSLSDNQTTENPNGEESVGNVSTDKPVISLSKLTFTNKDPLPPLVPELEPEKDVTKTEGGESINHGDVALSSEFVYALKSSRLNNQRSDDLTEWSILDNYDERYDRYNNRFEVVAMTNFGDIKKGDVLDKKYFTAENKDGKVNFVATKDFLDVVNANKDKAIQVEIRASFFRHTSADVVYNSFVETINGEKMKSNEVDTKTPKPEPHKFNVVGEKVDLKGDKLLDDDDEMKDRYKDTKTDPYKDEVKNNETFNFNTKAVKKGDTIRYQLWLDTTSFDETSELSVLQMVDDYDEKTVEPDVKQVKVYNAKGEEVTKHFQSEVKDGKLIVRANAFVKATDSQGKEVNVVDTEKIPFGQIYKIEFPVKVKEDVKDKTNIVNVANQEMVDSEGSKTELTTETRVNPVDEKAPAQLKETPKGELPSTGERVGKVFSIIGAGILSIAGGMWYFKNKKAEETQDKN